MSIQPLAEVFGFPVTNECERAVRYRRLKLCPFNNRIPNCTKDKAEWPLGVCSMLHEGSPIIICPVRFRQEWLIAKHAATFFFPSNAKWTSLTEVRLKDASGATAGNIDMVLVSYNNSGRISDFGALEVQSVYVSGNVRQHFAQFMQDQENPASAQAARLRLNPRPDFLSSSRKRLAPQLLFKGGIIKSWNRKMAVALDRRFFATLPALEAVEKEEADIAWMIYELQQCPQSDVYVLQLYKMVYTSFEAALDTITKPSPGREEDFVNYLQEKLDAKLANGGKCEKGGSE